MAPAGNVAGGPSSLIAPHADLTLRGREGLRAPPDHCIAADWRVRFESACRMQWAEVPDQRPRAQYDVAEAALTR